MQKLLSFSLLVLLLSGPLAASECTSAISHFFLKRSKVEKLSDFDYIKKIDRLERLNNRLRNFRDPPLPALRVRTNKKLLKLEALIVAGDVHTLERELGPLFRRVEMSYLIARNNHIVIEALEAVDTIVDWKQLEALGIPKGQIELWQRAHGLQVDSATLVQDLTHQRSRALKELGLNYHEYRIFREHLDDLLEAKNCTPECIQALRHLDAELGVAAKKEQLRFPNLLAEAARPELELIREMVHSSKVASLVRLRKERNTEIFAAFGAFFKKATLVDILPKRIASLSLMLETKLVRLFKSIYDQRARELFFPEMNRMLRSELKELQESLAKLKEINAKFESDEFLITLSRRIDGMAKDFWAALKEQALKNDPSFLERMIKAEGKGKQLGGLSLIAPPTFLGKVSVLLVGGAAGVTYFSLSPDEITVTPLPSEEQVHSIRVSIDDEESEKIMDELGEILEENKAIFAPEKEGDLSLWVPSAKERLPANEQSLNNPPGNFTIWFKEFYFNLRGKYLWP